jgi:hypothetical protein
MVFYLVILYLTIIYDLLTSSLFIIIKQRDNLEPYYQNILVNTPLIEFVKRI